MRAVLLLSLASFLFFSCSTSSRIQKSARQFVLRDPALQTAHVGISVYEPATGKWWYNHQGDKYFVPASNTKIVTCYAAMKYLGDSLVGLRYGIPEEEGWRANIIAIDVAGDPTFLHEDYATSPVFDFLKKQLIEQKKRPGILYKPNRVERWGSGWSWNDYDAAYMAERSEWPIYGNVVKISLNDRSKRTYIDTFLMPGKRLVGKVFLTHPSYFESLVNKRIRGGVGRIDSAEPKLRLTRSIAANEFVAEMSGKAFNSVSIPFVTDKSQTTSLLNDTLNSKYTWSLVEKTAKPSEYSWLSDDGDIDFFHIANWHVIHSQPTDSLLRPLMHRSDNFFAEQALLMVSNEVLGYMSDGSIIDTLLKTDFKDLPQKPRWADGSGLSRYNLFTPQDFVIILQKIKAEFGMDRVREIFPTGNEGTLTNYYKADSSYLYGKTGTLAGVVAFSGYMTTGKGRELIFSVLVNNHQASATAVRRAVEKFIQNLRQNH